MLLPSIASAALLAPKNTFIETVTTTLVEESTTYIVVDGQTEETVVNGVPTVIEIAAAETTVDFQPLFTHTVADATTISVEIEPQALRLEDIEFTGKLNGAPFTKIAPFVTTWTYPGTTLSLSFPPRQTAFRFEGAVSTEITIPSEHTHVTVNGIETAVDLPGLTTTLTITDSTNVIVDLPEVTTALEFTAESYVFIVTIDTIDGNDSVRFCGTDDAQILTDRRKAGIGAPCIVGTTFAVTLPSEAPALFLHADGLTTTFTLPGITTTFIPEQTITITKDGSTETSVIPAVVSTYVTTISDANASFSEDSSTESIAGPVTITVTVTEPCIIEPGSDVTVSQGVYTSGGSAYTTDVEVPITTHSGAVSQPQRSANVPTTSVGSLNTACSVVLGPMSGEDVALLDVIFNSGIDGTTYAQWLVNYASELTRQIDDVAAQAMADSGRQYTTAFNTIDITGILGLASAAPMYTCYLSSLWAEALSNPQQYARGDISTQDEKTKLIVLFERRDDNSGNYDLAELLVDEIDYLIAQMNFVICDKTDNQSNYSDLFTGLDVGLLRSLASEAPVYTKGLSAAFSAALSSYSAVATDGKV